MNHHWSVNMKFYSRDWLIHSLSFISEEYLGESWGGGGGGILFTFFPWKGVGGAY